MCFSPSESLQSDFEEREATVREEYEQRIRDIQKKFSEDLNQSRTELEAKYKKDFGTKFRFW